MASTAIEFGPTLVPYRPIYGDREIVLLTDTFFAAFNQPRELPLIKFEEPSMPKVIAMPNRAQFEATVSRWLNDMAFDSLPDQMKDHDSFREIVKEGNRVVPLIAANLRRTPSFLFLALEEIFGEDPVPEDAYGNLQSTVSSWLRWLQR